MLSAEIRSYYFAELSGKYFNRQKAATWATLLFSSGAAAALMANLPREPEWIRLAPLALAIVTAAISLYSVVMQNQKLGIDAADLHAGWNRLGLDYQRLWDNVYAEDAQSRLEDLENRSAELSKTGTAFPNKVRAMRRWQQYVVEHRLAGA